MTVFEILSSTPIAALGAKIFVSYVISWLVSLVIIVITYITLCYWRKIMRRDQVNIDRSNYQTVVNYIYGENLENENVEMNENEELSARLAYVRETVQYPVDYLNENKMPINGYCYLLLFDKYYWNDLKDLGKNPLLRDVLKHYPTIGAEFSGKNVDIVGTGLQMHVTVDPRRSARLSTMLDLSLNDFKIGSEIRSLTSKDLATVVLVTMPKAGFWLYTVYLNFKIFFDFVVFILSGNLILSDFTLWDKLTNDVVYFAIVIMGERGYILPDVVSYEFKVYIAYGIAFVLYSYNKYVYAVVHNNIVMWFLNLQVKQLLIYIVMTIINKVLNAICSRIVGKDFDQCSAELIGNARGVKTGNNVRELMGTLLLGSSRAIIPNMNVYYRREVRNTRRTPNHEYRVKYKGEGSNAGFYLPRRAPANAGITALADNALAQLDNDRMANLRLGLISSLHNVRTFDAQLMNNINLGNIHAGGGAVAALPLGAVAFDEAKNLKIRNDISKSIDSQTTHISKLHEDILHADAILNGDVTNITRDAIFNLYTASNALAQNALEDMFHVERTVDLVTTTKYSNNVSLPSSLSASEKKELKSYFSALNLDFDDASNSNNALKESFEICLARITMLGIDVGSRVIITGLFDPTHYTHDDGTCDGLVFHTDPTIPGGEFCKGKLREFHDYNFNRDYIVEVFTGDLYQTRERFDVIIMVKCAYNYEFTIFSTLLTALMVRSLIVCDIYDGSVALTFSYFPINGMGLCRVQNGGEDQIQISNYYNNLTVAFDRTNVLTWLSAQHMHQKYKVREVNHLDLLQTEEDFQRISVGGTPEMSLVVYSVTRRKTVGNQNDGEVLIPTKLDKLRWIATKGDGYLSGLFGVTISKYSIIAITSNVWNTTTARIAYQSKNSPNTATTLATSIQQTVDISNAAQGILGFSGDEFSTNFNSQIEAIKDIKDRLPRTFMDPEDDANISVFMLIVKYFIASNRIMWDFIVSSKTLEQLTVAGLTGVIGSDYKPKIDPTTRLLYRFRRTIDRRENGAVMPQRVRRFFRTYANWWKGYESIPDISITLEAGIAAGRVVLDPLANLRYVEGAIDHMGNYNFLMPRNAKRSEVCNGSSNIKVSHIRRSIVGFSTEFERSHEVLRVRNDQWLRTVYSDMMIALNAFGSSLNCINNLSSACSLSLHSTNGFHSITTTNNSSNEVILIFNTNDGSVRRALTSTTDDNSEGIYCNDVILFHILTNNRLRSMTDGRCLERAIYGYAFNLYYPGVTSADALSQPIDVIAACNMTDTAILRLSVGNNVMYVPDVVPTTIKKMVVVSGTHAYAVDINAFMLAASRCKIVDINTWDIPIGVKLRGPFKGEGRDVEPLTNEMLHNSTFDNKFVRESVDTSDNIIDNYVLGVEPIINDSTLALDNQIINIKNKLIILGSLYGASDRSDALMECIEYDLRLDLVITSKMRNVYSTFEETQDFAKSYEDFHIYYTDKEKWMRAPEVRATCVFNGYEYEDIPRREDLIIASRKANARGVKILFSNKEMLFIRSRKITDKFFNSILYKINYVKILRELNWTHTNGCPGSGKSYGIITSYRNTNVVSATLSTKIELQNGIAKKYPLQAKRNVKTIDSALLNGMAKNNALVADEAPLVHIGLILFVVLITEAKVLTTVGDVLQIPAISRLAGFEFLYSKFFCKTNLGINLTYRLNKMTTRLCRIFYPGMTTTSTIEGSMTLIENKGMPTVPSGFDLYMTFTQEEKVTLESISAYKFSTIHEKQGATCLNACVIRIISQESTIFSSQPHIIVGVTRHKVSFTYITTNVNDDMSKFMTGRYITEAEQLDKNSSLLTEITMCGNAGTKVIYSGAKVSLATNAYDRLTSWMYWFYGVTNSAIPQILSISHVPINNLGNNAPENIHVSVVQDVLDSMYKRHDEKYNNSLRTPLSIDLTPFVINPSRYRPYIIENMKASVTPTLTTPQNYKYDNTLNSLYQSVVARNLNPPKLFQLRSADFPLKVFRHGMSIFFDDSKIAAAIINIPMESTVQIDTWINTRNANLAKNLDKASYNIPASSRTKYKGSVKADYKPKLNNTHMQLAAGQVIAAMDPVLIAELAVYAKIIMQRFKASLKDKWCIADGATNEELDGHVNYLLPVQCRVIALELDVAKFDKSQDEVSLDIFVLILKRFGMPEVVANLYRNEHIKTRIDFREYGLLLHTKLQRKSGEPFTLLGNTAVNMFAVAYTYDLFNAYGGFFIGDDSLVFQTSLAVLVNETERIGKLFNFDAKIDTTPGASSFASKLLVFANGNYRLVPDPIKAITRLGRHDLHCKEHVELLYVSYLDNMKAYKDREVRQNLTLNAYARYSKKINVTHLGISLIIEFLASLLYNKNKFLSIFSAPDDIWKRKMPKSKIEVLFFDRTYDDSEYLLDNNEDIE